jgi:hypothetical protein
MLHLVRAAAGCGPLVIGSHRLGGSAWSRDALTMTGSECLPLFPMEQP